MLPAQHCPRGPPAETEVCVCRVPQGRACTRGLVGSPRQQPVLLARGEPPHPATLAWMAFHRREWEAHPEKDGAVSHSLPPLPNSRLPGRGPLWGQRTLVRLEAPLGRAQPLSYAQVGGGGKPWGRGSFTFSSLSLRSWQGSVSRVLAQPLWSQLLCEWCGGGGVEPAGPRA